MISGEFIGHIGGHKTRCVYLPSGEDEGDKYNCYRPPESETITETLTPNALEHNLRMSEGNEEVLAMWYLSAGQSIVEAAYAGIMD